VTQNVLIRSYILVGCVIFIIAVMCDMWKNHMLEYFSFKSRYIQHSLRRKSACISLKNILMRMKSKSKIDRLKKVNFMILTIHNLGKSRLF